MNTRDNLSQLIIVISQTCVIQKSNSRDEIYVNQKLIEELKTVI